MKSFLSLLIQQDVPLEKIRHNPAPCYVAEGYGGKSLEDWPVYTFFKLYVEGEKSEATRQFIAWYKEQLAAYGHIASAEGGMKYGSLYRLIEQMSKKPYAETSDDDKADAIAKRVEQRFAFLESIRKEGYRNDTEPVYAYRGKDLVYLKGGHHRAAALMVLGYETFPCVFVFPNKVFYNVFLFFKKIKKYAKI